MKLTDEERVQRHTRRMLRELEAMKQLPGGGRGGVWWPDGMTGQEVKAAFRNGTMRPRPGAEPCSMSAIMAGCTCRAFAGNDYRAAYVSIDKACRWHGNNPEDY